MAISAVGKAGDIPLRWLYQDPSLVRESIEGELMARTKKVVITAFGDGFESFDESYSILKRGGVLVGYGMNLPAWTNTPERSVIPSALKLFSKNLFFWSGKRTTFFGVNRGSKHFASDLQQLFEWLKDGRISCQSKTPSGLMRSKRHIGSMPAANASVLL
ncbi:hypothetical protein RBB77_21400 [Tunturibacter psychrotolerans]|uniref:Alcohol dehydrogenase-like C-terminal domain-containing protein n=1 Tax=Tunturiibacter psychrotolerans TaxID=3069686 RepID=A0AAU7ZPT4_9BACT